MGAFGERLRRERELRGISLDEIAATTKIGTRLLRALEDEQFELLPGGIFNKGYVRAYAKYVGIDEEQAVADYLLAVQDVVPGGHAAADQAAYNPFERSSRDDTAAGRRSVFPVVPVLIALVLVAGIAGAWRLLRERQLDRQRASAVGAANDATLHNSTASPSVESSMAKQPPPPSSDGSGQGEVGSTGSKMSTDASSDKLSKKTAADGRTAAQAQTDLNWRRLRRLQPTLQTTSRIRQARNRSNSWFAPRTALGFRSNPTASL